MLVEKFRTISRILIDNVALQTQAAPGVELTYAFRTQPEGGPIELQEGLHLGPVVQDLPLRVLFEFSIEPSASKNEASDPAGWHSACRSQEPPDTVGADGAAHAAAGGRHGGRAAALRVHDGRAFDACAVSAAGARPAGGQGWRIRSGHAASEEPGRCSWRPRVNTDCRRLPFSRLRIWSRIKALSEKGGKEIKYGTRALLLPPPESACMIRCSNCASSNLTGAVFCSECGALLQLPAGSASARRRPRLDERIGISEAARRACLRPPPATIGPRCTSWTPVRRCRWRAATSSRWDEAPNVSRSRPTSTCRRMMPSPAASRGGTRRFDGGAAGSCCWTSTRRTAPT